MSVWCACHFTLSLGRLGECLCRDNYGCNVSFFFFLEFLSVQTIKTQAGIFSKCCINSCRNCSCLAVGHATFSNNMMPVDLFKMITSSINSDRRITFLKVNKMYYHSTLNKTAVVQTLDITDHLYC